MITNILPGTRHITRALPLLAETLLARSSTSEALIDFAPRLLSNIGDQAAPKEEDASPWSRFAHSGTLVVLAPPCTTPTPARWLFLQELLHPLRPLNLSPPARRARVRLRHVSVPARDGERRHAERPLDRAIRSTRESPPSITPASLAPVKIGSARI
ncbi:hypothetical protein HYPSUDRAFT_203865 [Hypholoma sublateritium FD-334 SS-4]|uniref:Uncharacterized protein n=1 Tax=Hypholoma sublateritium (strain FD-334 SS-4) TaxID=945553 RepID=A0A0D2NUZ8_HYPSF|nr:hypothetical protein HYPSUDRAFT_203865 [Hypholoma sublateritium FD-334 SS-4]